MHDATTAGGAMAHGGAPRSGVRALVLLGTLYVPQFVVFGFIGEGLVAILRRSGQGLESVGLIYAIALLFSARFLWAPAIDRWGAARFGHYRSWLMPLQCVLVAVPLLLVPYPPSSGTLPALAVAATVLAIVAATQNIAADALAVTILATGERGPANGLQAAAALLGNLLGGGLLLAIFDRFGWPAAMILLSLFAVLACIRLLALREPQRQGSVQSANFASILRFFRRTGKKWAGLLFLAFGSVGFSTAVLIPLLTDLGWSLTRIAVVVSTVGSLLGALGALATGAFIARLGRRRAWLAALALQVIAAVLLLAVAAGASSSSFTTVTAVATMVSWGVASAVLYTLIMDHCRPETGGTDFAAQVCVGGIAATGLGGVAITLAASLGYLVIVAIGLLLLGATFATVFRSYGSLDLTT